MSIRSARIKSVHTVPGTCASIHSDSPRALNSQAPFRSTASAAVAPSRTCENAAGESEGPVGPAELVTAFHNKRGRIIIETFERLNVLRLIRHSSRTSDLNH